MAPESDPLQSLWNSPGNQPAAFAADRLASSFLAEMRRRHRVQTLWLVWTVAAMVAITALGATQVAQGRVRDDGILVLVTLIAGPWGVTLWMVRRWWSEPRPTLAPETPLRDAVCAAHRANRSARRRLHVVGGLIVAMMPVLALAIVHLHAAGKLAVREAWSMGVLFAATLTLTLAVMVWRDVRRLGPQGRHLERLARDLNLP